MLLLFTGINLFFFTYINKLYIYLTLNQNSKFNFDRDSSKRKLINSAYCLYHYIKAFYNYLVITLHVYLIQTKRMFFFSEILCLYRHNVN